MSRAFMDNVAKEAKAAAPLMGDSRAAREFVNHTCFTMTPWAARSAMVMRFLRDERQLVQGEHWNHYVSPRSVTG